jgi:transcriptional regulator with XRE-family HTH domain
MATSGRTFTGERLKELRKACGWTQAELSTRTGVSDQMISHLEKNLRRPSLDIALALADGLGMPLDVLLDAPGSPIPLAVPTSLQHVVEAVA